MMANIGKDTPGGFIPQVPALGDDLLKRLFGDTDQRSISEAGQEQARRLKAASDDIKRAYASFYNDPRGRVIFEDLLDQTLRRGASHPDVNAGIEQEALYSRERKGQNSIVTYMLKMAHDGMSLPAQSKAKSVKK